MDRIKPSEVPEDIYAESSLQGELEAGGVATSYVRKKKAQNSPETLQ